MHELGFGVTVFRTPYCYDNILKQKHVKYYKIRK